MVQGVAAARNAWRKKNAAPQTKKEEKRARPTGRGDGPPGGGRGGGRGPPGGGRGIGGAGRGAAHPSVVGQMQQGRGGGANSNSGLRSEKSAWMALIDDLNKKYALL